MRKILLLAVFFVFHSCNKDSKSLAYFLKFTASGNVSYDWIVEKDDVYVYDVDGKINGSISDSYNAITGDKIILKLDSGIGVVKCSIEPTGDVLRIDSIGTKEKNLK